MGQIQVMSEALANQIAAGEVVERPASCVKELFENSLDAGAKTIVVQLEEGGIKRIRVQDDGHGMDEGDLRLAFSRHATSKVKSSRDLFRIGTLGFRGEALASIAAVARVKLQSRMADSEQGHGISVEGSTTKGAVEPVGMPVGTIIEVADLFFNTPARLKYLRTVQTEQARCVEVVQKAALSRPDVRMRVDVDGHVLFQTTGAGNPQNVLATLYGVGEAGQLLHIEGQTPDYRIAGYIGRPTQARSSRTHANLFVNQRPIRNIAVHQAIAGGYGQRLMVNKQPMYAVYIDLDPGLVDVNIHPHKSEVRFSEERDLTQFLQQLVRTALDEAFLVPTARLNSTGSRAEQGPRPVQTGLGIIPKSPWHDANRPQAGHPQSRQPQSEQPLAGHVHKQAQSDGGVQTTQTLPAETVGRATPKVSASTQQLKYPAGTRSLPPEVLESMYGGDNSTGPVVRERANDSGHPATGEPQARPTSTLPDAQTTPLQGDAADISEENAAAGESVVPSAELSAPTREGWRLRPIGQTLGMYILADDGEDLYIIDQHAAHERVLYERFTKQMKARSAHSIELLTPMPFHLSPGDAAVLTQHIDVLAEMGLSFEPFGGYSFMLRSIPAVWDGLDPSALAQELVSSLAEDTRAVDVKVALRERIIMRACKAAIKANHRLSDMEMRALIDAFSDLDDPFHCPHGRPVFVRLTSRDLEKEFRRIV